MSFYALLIIGVAAVFVTMYLVGGKYDIPGWKCILTAVALTATGAIGSMILYFIETGSWGGRSFFGGAFLLPVLMYPVAKVLKASYGDIMDLCGPGGAIMLIISKVKCAMDGCCYGRLIRLEATAFRFPSQIVESVMGVVLLVILMVMIVRGRNRGNIYFWCLLLYGISRFFLNFLRETTPVLGPLAYGNIWSLLAIATGLAVILYNKKKRDNL